MLSSLANLKPVPRAALTSCSLMALGDVVCQTINHRRTNPHQQLQIDFGRAARFSIIGLTLHGPFFCKGFQWLDKRFGKEATFRNAITKSLVGQFTLFPTYTPLFLVYASLLEGQSLQQACDKVVERLPKVLVTGSVYWPIVNILNFKFVPVQQRVLAMNVCAIAWNAYLSFVSSAPLPQPKLPAAL